MCPNTLDIRIIEQTVEEMVNIDQSFDLVYMDPPFGLQRDFKMEESMVQRKVSLTIDYL